MESRSRGWLYAAGAAVACAGVLVAGNVAFAGRSGPDSASVLPAANGPAPTQAPTRVPSKSGAPAPDPSAESNNPKPLGQVIETGLAAKSGKWVLYAVPVTEMPKIHFGIMLGHRAGSGDVVGDVMTNETVGSDRSPGFHGAEGSMGIDAGQSLTFGYYAGPATRITGKSHGKTVTAKQAAWSKDSSVIVYWFPASVTGISGLKAYDKAGHVLPAGHSGIAVG